jgi:hypothetical protein
MLGIVHECCCDTQVDLQDRLLSIPYSNLYARNNPEYGLSRVVPVRQQYYRLEISYIVITPVSGGLA